MKRVKVSNNALHVELERLQSEAQVSDAIREANELIETHASCLTADIAGELRARFGLTPEESLMAIAKAAVALAFASGSIGQSEAKPARKRKASKR